MDYHPVTVVVCISDTSISFSYNPILKDMQPSEAVGSWLFSDTSTPYLQISTVLITHV